MPTFRTGRQRTLRWSGALGGAIHTVYYTPDFGLGPAPDILTLCTYSISAAGCSLTAAIGDNDIIITSPPSTFDFYTEWIVTANNGIGSSATDMAEERTSFTMPPSSDIHHNLDVGGTWYIEADVEECVEITYSGYGDANLHHLQPCTLRFFERLRVGGTLSCSITSGGATATDSDTITTATEITYPCAMDAEAETSGAARPTSPTEYREILGDPVTASITGTMNGASLSAPYTRYGTKVY